MYHDATHFVQWYSEELEALVSAAVPPPPSAEAAWRDLKTGSGRGAYLTLFQRVCALSAGCATASSIVLSEQAERRLRNAKALIEDGE